MLLLLSHFSRVRLCATHTWQPTTLPHSWDSPGKNTGVGCHFLLQTMKVKSESEIAQSCPTLCDPVGCSPPDSSIQGILQVRILEWVAISFSRGSSQPRDQICVSCIAGRCFTIWATREYDNGSSLEDPMHILLHSVPPTLQQATTDPRLHWRPLDTPGKVWVSLWWGQGNFSLDN